MSDPTYGKERWKVIFSGIQAVCVAIGTLLALYGVFFTRLPETIIRQLRSDITNAKEELIDLRRQRRETERQFELSQTGLSKTKVELEQKTKAITDLELKRAELDAQLRSLSHERRKYFSNTYNIVVGDFVQTLHSRLDDLRRDALKAREFPQFKTWLSEGRELLLEQQKEQIEVAVEERDEVKLIEKSQNISQQQGLEQGINDSKKIDQRINEIKKRDIEAKDKFEQRMKELTLTEKKAKERYEIARNKLDRLRQFNIKWSAWRERQPSAWKYDVALIKEEFERLLSKGDTNKGIQYAFNAYERREQEFERTITSEVDYPLTGNLLIENILYKLHLERLTEDDQKEFRARVRDFLSRESYTLAGPLMVKLHLGMTDQDVTARAVVVIDRLDRLQIIVNALDQHLRSGDV